MTLLLRAAGLALVGLSTLPIYRLLVRDTATTVGSWLLGLLETADAVLGYMGWGMVIIVLVAGLLAYFAPSEPLRARLRYAGDRSLAVPVGYWAGGLGLVAGLLALVVQRTVFSGLFTNVDEMASMVHARFMAEGALGGVLPGLPEAWLFPNMLVVEQGLVSHFPVGHVAVMAAFVKAGIPDLVGPLSLGVMVAFAALSFPRLLPAWPRTARASGVLVAVSPFLLLIGAGSLSHVSAGAAAMIALWAALQARDGSALWAIVAGAAVGVLVTSRPWTGLVLGAVVTAGVWIPDIVRSRDLAAAARRVGGTLVGGVPFAIAFGWANQSLFGHPARLGYLVAWGERHQLGFHDTPWSFYYGPAEALGFTSLDVLSLGVQLLETPIPLGLAIGALFLTGRLPRGSGLLAVICLTPIVVNFVYWFHSPRMYFEAVPAWIGLTALAVASLATAPAPRSASPSATGLPRYGRDFTLWAALLSLVFAFGVGIPSRLGATGWNEETLTRIVPPVPAGGASVVFVHTSWSERISASLQGAGGMRPDSIIAALRRNSSCALHGYADARARSVAGGGAVSGVVLPDIDLEQTPGEPDDLLRPRAQVGTSLRVREGELLSDDCRRQIQSDRFGATALAPLVWQGDLPGSTVGMPLYVRDLGPEKNARLRSFFPGRIAWVFVPKTSGAPPELVPYDEAMRVLWGSGPAPDR